MIRELHEKLERGEITARLLTEGYLKTIAEKNPELNAYLTVFEKEALAKAESIDIRFKQGEKLDLLAGIPGALKDNICVAETRTTAGSKILDNYIAPKDATVVERLSEKGALLLGKTNMDEFAMGSSTENSAYGVVKNPLDTSRVSGGSSGGSAVAVASDMAVWALGSDTGGSIRQPASFCGVVGLKPTYGRVSRSGLIAMASSLDQIGVFGKNVEDVAIVSSRIIGSDPLDATTAEEKKTEHFEENLTGDIRGLRIGLPKEYFSEELPQAIQEQTEKAIHIFKTLGCEIVPVSLPESRFALPVYYILMPAEVSSNLARLDGMRYGLSVNDKEDSLEKTLTPVRNASLARSRSPSASLRQPAVDTAFLAGEALRADSGSGGRIDAGGLLETYLDTRRIGFGSEVKRRIMLGTYTLSAGYYDAYYKKAQKVRALIRRDFEEAFQKVDVLFSPTTPEVAFPIGEKTSDPLKMYLSDIYTVTANLTGVPAISFPLGTIEEGGKALPIGGQFMGKWFDEKTLFQLVHAFEQNSV